MLYVFQVDMGRMMKFDMNVALSRVQNLKEVIERLHGIPASNIILLVSGGEMLTPDSLVCSYSAGTDTNPIYMFSNADVKPQPWPSIEPDVDLSEQVERCLSLPAIYPTVVARSQLAQQIYDIAREEESICERLVHEQHLQQQGWATVIANMEDLTDRFKQRFGNFCLSFDRHLEKRSEYLELLANFNEDLTNLSHIPILPGLMQLAEKEFHGFDELLDNDEVFSRSTQQESMILASDGSHKKTHQRLSSTSESQDDEKRDSTSPNKKLKMGSEEKISASVSSAGAQGRRLTLLQWISAKENHQSLRVMAEECAQSLATFDKEKYEKLKAEILNVIAIAEQEEIKEIKGLGDRLCGLEELMFKIKKFVQDQKELATAFQQNQNRASNLGDASILPDLCASHQSQLLVMLNNQKQIRDFRRRISKAKDELGVNLYKRIKYITQIESSMSEFDSTLLFYNRVLLRAERHLSIIRQIHQTPYIYVEAVTEVVRRKIFSGEFIQWASTLACDFDAIHSEEMERRHTFNSIFEGHFLNTLFPGMKDMPPAFANENPLMFDAGLPNITKNDIEILSSYLPDLTNQVRLPDMGTVIDFFISRSGNRMSDDKICSSPMDSKMQSGSMQPGQQRPIEMQANVKDGCESETDTEEFEKVSQSAKHEMATATTTIATSTNENITQNISTETDPILTHNAETLTEDNLGSTRHEVERLRSILKTMSHISFESINLLRSNLQTIRTEHDNGTKDLQNEIIRLSEKWLMAQQQAAAREHNAKIEHMDKISELQSALAEKDKQIEMLRNEQQSLESNHVETVKFLHMKCDSLREDCEKFQKDIEQLQSQLQMADSEKERALAEIQEKLIHEHKTEIESLRCRFKLMTSMERSPSDSSLEKIEKPDMIDIACHESILSQTREEFLSAKEQAIKEAIAMERSRWESQIVPAASPEIVANLNLLKQIIEDREKQLETIREHNLHLTTENCQLKIRIEGLTNEEESDRGWLKEKIDFLNRDKNRLEQELNMEKSRRVEMETSFAAMRNSTLDSLSNTSTSASTITRSKSQNVSSQRCAVLESCNKGDIVFVIWNIRHGQFVVVQDSPNLYFVHAESLLALNLRLPVPGDMETPLPFCALGRVIDKEYCQARKDENRYRVTKGTKFYRIKLVPLAKPEFRWQQRRERLESQSSTCSSVSRSTSTQHLIDSSAQTEIDSEKSALIAPKSPNTISKDIVDSAYGSTGGHHKERTISISSVAEEDDEPISLLSDRCRYISVSEEEEARAVITEQPTSTKMDYACSSSSISTDLPSGSSSTNTTTTSNTTTTTTNTTSNLVTCSSLADSSNPIAIDSSSICSLDKDPDESDEYRSLEAKDDTD